MCILFADITAHAIRIALQRPEVCGLYHLVASGQTTTTEISREKQPEGLEQNRVIAKQGGTIAGNTRKEIEEKTGKPVVSSKNAKQRDEFLQQENIRRIGEMAKLFMEAGIIVLTAFISPYRAVRERV